MVTLLKESLCLNLFRYNPEQRSLRLFIFTTSYDRTLKKTCFHLKFLLCQVSEWHNTALALVLYLKIYYQLLLDEELIFEETRS